MTEKVESEIAGNIDFLTKAWEKSPEILKKIKNRKKFADSPLVGATEVIPAESLLIIQATKDEFRTIHLKKSNQDRLIFDCKLLVGQLQPLVRPGKEDINLEAGDQMSIMLGDPKTPSPSVLYKKLKEFIPFKGKIFGLANNGKEKFEGKNFWNMDVLTEAELKTVLTS